MKLKNIPGYLLAYSQLASRHHPDTKHRRLVLIAALSVWLILIAPTCVLLVVLKTLEALKEAVTDIVRDFKDMPGIVRDSWRGEEVWSWKRWGLNLAHLKARAAQ